MKDSLQIYAIAGGEARAYIIKSTQICLAAQETHNMTPVTAAALGRTLTAAAIMGAQMKNQKDALTITISGGGPIGKIVVCSNRDARVKGFVSNPQVLLEDKYEGKLDVGGAVGKSGTLSVVRDIGMKEPYMGQVELVSGEIGEDFASYFLLSEQQPTLTALGVRFLSGKVVAAGGAILAPMPGCSEETLRFLEGCAPLLSDVSSHFIGNETADVAEFLLHPISHELLSEITPEYYCGCGREKMEKALISLGEEELKDIIDKDGKAELHCHFCGEKFSFTKDELIRLLNNAKS